MRWLGLLALAACADGSTVPDFDRACDASDIDGDCIVFTGAGWEEADVVSGCDGEVVAECPGGASGRCTIDEGLSFETQSYFYPSFWPGNSGSQACLAQPNSSWEIL